MSLKLQATDDGVRIAVKAVPGSSRDRLAGLLGDALRVCVAAPPEDGKANDRLCAFLAEALDLPHRNIRVVAGHASRAKTVLVRGMPAEEIRGRILAALEKA